MIAFSQRLAIVERFAKWANKNRVKPNHLSFLTFLEIEGLLRESVIHDRFPFHQTNANIRELYQKEIKS